MTSQALRRPQAIRCRNCGHPMAQSTAADVAIKPEEAKERVGDSLFFLL
jgi:hypothetical protein